MACGGHEIRTTPFWWVVKTENDVYCINISD